MIAFQSFALVLVIAVFETVAIYMNLIVLYEKHLRQGKSPRVALKTIKCFSKRPSPRISVGL